MKKLVDNKQNIHSLDLSMQNRDLGDGLNLLLLSELFCNHIADFWLSMWPVPYIK